MKSTTLYASVYERSARVASAENWPFSERSDVNGLAATAWSKEPARRVPPALAVHRQTFVEPGGDETQAGKGQVADQYVGQFVSSALLPISNRSVETEDNNIIFGKRLSTHPGRLIKDGILQIALISINIDIDRAVGGHANILRKPYQRLGGRIVQLLTERRTAIIVMQIDVPAVNDLPGMDIIKPQDGLGGTGELCPAGIGNQPVPPDRGTGRQPAELKHSQVQVTLTSMPGVTCGKARH